MHHISVRVVRCSILALFISLNASLAAQTSIQGVVNSYSAVTGVPANDQVTLASGLALSCGDRLLIAQMQGASYQGNGGSNPGYVASVNGAGLYEFATVASVSGNTVTLAQPLTHAAQYNASASLQAVLVPNYGAATVMDTLKAKAWNGTTGGILALEVDNQLTLNAPVDVTGLGFAAGRERPDTTATPTDLSPPGANCSGFDNFYDYPNSLYSCEKGHGIAIPTATQDGGVAPMSNGGGSGGFNTGGGGGGAGYGAGGQGGYCNSTSFCFIGCSKTGVAGDGGQGLGSLTGGSGTNNRLFLGGGGGAGNNGAGQYYKSQAQGEPGGGAVLIRAGQLVANGYAIRANGATRTTPNSLGCGGGGGAGSILLDVGSYDTSGGNLQLEAKGGDGIDLNKTTNMAKEGPGGGGGGGMIWLSSGSLPAGVATDVQGGTNGENIHLSPSDAHGATAGSNGATLTGLTLPGTPPSFAGPLSVTIPQMQPATCGQNNGSITAQGQGGTAPYSYSWTTTPPQNVAQASNLPPGNYTVQVTDAPGCDTVDTTVTLSNLAAPTLALDSTTAEHCGQGDGTAAVSASGGAGVISFSWDTSPVQTDSVATGLSSGNYQVIATDTNACSDTLSVTIGSQSAPSLSLDSTTADFCNQTNGTAAVTAAGGQPPYTYSFNTTPPTTDSLATGLAQGSYEAYVTDDEGCSDTLAFAIGGAGNPAVTIIDSTDATCAQANGLAVASGIGGTGPLSYSWNTVPPQTGDTAQGLAPGTYTVTVTDTAGCSSTASVAIDSLSAPSLDSLSVQNEACGQGNGQASVSVTGGFAPYSYQWNTMPQQSGDTAQGLSAGLYTAIVTDSLGCQDSVQLKVDTIPAPGLALAGLADDTCAAAKGSAIVAVSGGTAPYSYTWNTSPPQSGPQASGLSAGTYTVTLVDSFGCTDTTSATINALPGPTLDSLGSQAATCGQANGRAVVGAAGGTTPYSYNWLTTPPQMGDTAAGLGGGSYEAVVTDANGCQDTQSVTVAATPAPNLTPDTAVAEACGQQDGRAIVSASGGTPPYTIAWNTTPSQTGDTASGLAAGTYTATLVDAASCTTTASITIDTVGGPAAALAGRRPATCDSANGRARATASGGTAPYAYTWLPEGTSGTTLAGLAGGDYRLVATDARGCRDTLPFSIPATPALAIDSVVTRPAFCEQGNGSAAVVLSGGTAPFQYTGKAFGNDSVASNLTPATYSVTVIDSAGCRDSASFTIGNEPGPALAVADTANPSCRGNDGQLRVEATGGHAPYTYSWANAPQRTGPAATGLSAGSYTITVTDSAGCEATRQLTLTKNCVPQIQIPSVFTPNGDGINDVWRLRGEGIAEFKLVVYNQWGQQVHSSTNPSRAWDGRIGGERAPAGVYNYVIRYRLQGAEQTHRRAGTMTLLR